MKIVVVGGTGLIGAKVVEILSQRGCQVVAASPKNGVDTVTGEGLAEALAGASIVIDVSNFAALELFATSSDNLLCAAAAAGVAHHVLLSIVGADRVPDQPHFRAKVAQEAALKASGVRYTIVRSTQFLEFLPGIADGATIDGTVTLPAGLVQPVAADEVAAFLADVALADPQNGTVEIAGPDRAPFNELVGNYLKAIGDPRPVVSDPDARYFGGRLEETSLVPLNEVRLGRLHLEEWLRVRE